MPVPLRTLAALLFSLLLAGTALAGVSEKAVTLPNELGSAVLYEPKGRKPTAGVIVIHEWWGLDDYAKGRARQLAEKGYVALALDIFGHGKVAEHPRDAQGFVEAALAEPDKMAARFKAALQHLQEHRRADNDRLYAIGYCFGGTVVLNQARMGAEVAGVASFHGALGRNEHVVTDKPIQARILVATGGDDPMVPPEQVAEFVQEMMEADADLQLLSFPGVLHSFTNPAATEKGEQFDMPLAYDEYADKQSWKALLKMLEGKKK